MSLLKLPILFSRMPREFNRFREFERMPNGRYRFPRALRMIAHEYIRICIYTHRDMMQMRTYCNDLRREMGRLQRFRGQYTRQRAEILRLRVLVRSLRNQSANLRKIREQKMLIGVQRERISHMQNTMRDMRHTRSSLYRDWRETHSRCSRLTSENVCLKTDLELVKSQMIALQSMRS